jgi:hypothetical protein
MNDDLFELYVQATLKLITLEDPVVPTPWEVWAEMIAFCPSVDSIPEDYDKFLEHGEDVLHKIYAYAFERIGH